MIGSLIALAARYGVPEPLRRIAAWGGIAVAALALAGAGILTWNLWLGAHDRSVVKANDVKVEAKASAGREKSAEERGLDAFANAMKRAEREAAIKRAEEAERAKPPEQRAALPATTVALNCVRMREAYTAAQLSKMPDYREKCS